MKTWEYAAFQKEQFKVVKARKRKFYIILVASIVIGVVLFLMIPFLLDM